MSMSIVLFPSRKKKIMYITGNFLILISRDIIINLVGLIGTCAPARHGEILPTYTEYQPTDACQARHVSSFPSIARLSRQVL